MGSIVVLIEYLCQARLLWHPFAEQVPQASHV